jgi:hypothetical protein
MFFVAIAGLISVGILTVPKRLARREYLIAAASLLSGIVLLFTTSIAIPD